MAKFIQLDENNRFKNVLEIDLDDVPESININDLVEYDESKMRVNDLEDCRGLISFGKDWKWDEQNQEFYVEDSVLSEKLIEWRNLELKDSDWTQSLDFPESFRTMWQTYRQQLRDLPDQEGFPRVTLPEPVHRNPYGTSHLSANT